MFARRLSVLFSIMALGLMVLACSLGYRITGEERYPEAVNVTPSNAVSEPTVTAYRCQELGQELDRCSDAFNSAWAPSSPAHYPEKIRRIVAIKKHYVLGKQATRACEDPAGNRLTGASLDACLAHATCDDFAACVAESLEDF